MASNASLLLVVRPGAPSSVLTIFEFHVPSSRGKEKFKMPGPGSYMHDRDFSSKHQTQPSFGFGTGTRKTRVVNQAPGPGTYEEPGTLGDAKISCTPRSGLKNPRAMASNLLASLRLVAMPGAPSSVLAPSSDALCS